MCNQEDISRFYKEHLQTNNKDSDKISFAIDAQIELNKHEFVKCLGKDYFNVDTILIIGNRYQRTPMLMQELRTLIAYKNEQGPYQLIYFHTDFGYL